MKFWVTEMSAVKLTFLVTVFSEEFINIKFIIDETERIPKY